MTSAFATAAQQATQPQNTQQTQPESVEGRLMDGKSSLESRLFGGEKLPSLFTRSQGIGDRVAGVISGDIFEIQSRTFNREGPGQPRFWGPDNKPTTQAIGPDGKALRPIMDVVVPLQTAYRFTADELRQRGQEEDDGKRGWYLSAEDLKAFKAALKTARIASLAQLQGMRVTAWRSGTRPTGKGNPAWLYECIIER